MLLVMLSQKEKIKITAPTIATAILAIVFFRLMSPSACLAQKKLNVVTSLFPLQEMARAVGGDRTRVDLLLPEGAEPHAWEPKPSDIVTLTRADVFIYLGAGMEPWAESILKGINRPSLRVFKASQGLPAIDGTKEHDRYDHDHHDDHNGEHDHHSHDHHGSHDHQMDPHFWLDFSYDQIMVSAIAGVFSELDPAGAQFYMQNASRYQKKLAELDKKYQQGLKDCQSRKIFLGGHSAFSYLARRYHLDQITLYGISPDAEPSPRRLAQIVDLAKKQKVKAIFFEELISDRLANVLAKEAGAVTLMLNPGANVTKELVSSGVTFLSLMEKNLETLRKGLVCSE
ncbi:MAG: zinc ABC transporter substrate-binding protein [bacterium]